MRAASELGLRTVAIYSQEDRFSLHRTKADEAYLVGRDKGPVEAYLDIADILRVAREAQVEAIHPGYGFLAENPELAQACAQAGIVFVGPEAQTMRVLGNKVSARELAVAAGVAVMPATAPLPADPQECARLAASVGYPLMLKASWGGGGRGSRVVEDATRLRELLPVARREAQAAFGNDEVYLEKLVRRARHVEVQILGDAHGNLVHLFERDCTVQRRNQKVVERAPAVFLSDEQRAELCSAALSIGRASMYLNAGTVEFLQDADNGEVLFHRGESPHPGRAHCYGMRDRHRYRQGADPHRRRRAHRHAESGVPPQAEIRIDAHALQCRVTTEDPENNFIPDYGKITAYRSPAGFGIRLDAGTAYTGAIITRSYDSLLVKVTAWAPTPEEWIARMHRALWEFRIRGVVTNLRFLDQVITHPRFAAASTPPASSTRRPSSFVAAEARSRHAHPHLHRRDHRQRQPAGAGRVRPAHSPPRSCRRRPAPPPPGTRQKLEELGPERSRNGCSPSSACCSPTRPCAMRISRCSPRGCAPST